MFSVLNLVNWAWSLFDGADVGNNPLFEPPGNSGNSPLSGTNKP